MIIIGSAHYEWYHLWESGPEFNKKSGWVSHEKQVSKQWFSIASASVAIFKFLPPGSCPDFF